MQMDQESQSLGLFLRDKRMAAGFSQGDVAKKLGYSTAQFISNWERGLSAPPMDTLRVLSNLYNVPPEEMFEFMLDEAIQKMTSNMKSKFYGKKSS